LAPAALLTQGRPPGLVPRRHRPERELLVMCMLDALGGGVGPSTAHRGKRKGEAYAAGAMSAS